MYLINHHNNFNKRIGSCVISLSEILNAKLNYSNEEMKIKNSFDKSAKIQLSVRFDF